MLGLAQFEHANAGRNGHAGLMLQAERLQRNRAGIAANEHVRAAADTERSASLGAAVLAGKRVMRDVAGANTAQTRTVECVTPRSSPILLIRPV